MNNLSTVNSWITENISIEKVKNTYFSKSLGVKSNIDFFIIAKNIATNAEKVGVQTSVPPDHSARRIVLAHDL